MATIVNTAISTAIEGPDITHHSAIPSLLYNGNRSINPSLSYNGRTAEPQVNRSPRKMPKTKYSHAFAPHTQNRQSCLTHGAPQSPSFVGFRNLMILVLVFSNLRLMIENFRKVRRVLAAWTRTIANKPSTASSSASRVTTTVAKTSYTVSLSTYRYRVNYFLRISSSLWLHTKQKVLSRA
jgi:hypothetical protein